MKKEAFKIGETVWYMQANKPTSSTVTAVIVIEGKLRISYQDFESKDGEKLTVYSAGYGLLEEKEVFASKELLKESIFKSEVNA